MARTVTVLVLLLGTLVAASGASANFIGTGDDPAGDATDGSPGRDIVRVSLDYNRRTGDLRGGVQLAGDPIPTPANLTLFAGSSTSGGCNGYPAVGFGTLTDKTSVDWVRLNAADAAPLSGSAAKEYEEVAEDYQAFSVRELRGARPDCVVAQLNDPADEAVVYDVAGPFALQRLPELTLTPRESIQGVPPGRAAKVRFVLRNVGDAPSGPVRLSTDRLRGVRVELPRKAPRVQAGKRTVVTASVRMGKRAESFPSLVLTARTASGAQAQADTSLYRRSRPRPDSGGGGGGGDSGTKLCNTYTWLPPYSKLEPC